MADTSDPYAAFRLNLEQQRKRAKDVLRARRAAGVRDFKLTDAQFTIARELGFASWMALRAHIMAQTAERAAMEQSGPPLDASMRTLHIRCGTDIKHELEAAGFSGDFLSVWDPFPVGPVTAAPDWIAQRARFHASTGLIGPDVATLLADLTADDQRLARSADAYERVVIWMEHDSHDQLALVRCLAHYAKTRPPHVLELISVNHFPGSRRFIGLGQLPPEAMRLLWVQRERLGPSHLALGAKAWSGLTADDPRGLAALMRTGTPALSHLAPALHRHLRELPSEATGLSLTQFLILQLLDESASTIGDLWARYGSREPLPFLGDTMFLHIVNEMGRTRVPVLERTTMEAGQPFRDHVAITDAGRDVLRGITDWLTLQPPPRWVGGVQIDARRCAWRWDDEQQGAIQA
jgi:uncharacterized protein DUF1835